MSLGNMLGRYGSDDYRELSGIVVFRESNLIGAGLFKLEGDEGGYNPFHVVGHQRPSYTFESPTCWTLWEGDVPLTP